MTVTQLNELVVKLAQKLVEAQDRADTSAHSEAYWFGEYSKTKKELEALKSSIEKGEEGVSNG